MSASEGYWVAPWHRLPMAHLDALWIRGAGEAAHRSTCQQSHDGFLLGISKVRWVYHIESLILYTEG